MCFSTPSAKPTIVDPASRASNAAADAVVQRRKNAQGFGASFGAGFNAGTPSIARQLLLGGG